MDVAVPTCSSGTPQRSSSHMIPWPMVQMVPPIKKAPSRSRTSGELGEAFLTYSAYSFLVKSIAFPPDSIKSNGSLAWNVVHYP